MGKLGTYYFKLKSLQHIHSIIKTLQYCRVLHLHIFEKLDLSVTNELLYQLSYISIKYVYILSYYCPYVKKQHPIIPCISFANSSLISIFPPTETKKQYSIKNSTRRYHSPSSIYLLRFGL